MCLALSGRMCGGFGRTSGAVNQDLSWTQTGPVCVSIGQGLWDAQKDAYGAAVTRSIVPACRFLLVWVSRAVVCRVCASNHAVGVLVCIYSGDVLGQQHVQHFSGTVGLAV